MSWTKAIHFKSWADTQESRHKLPLLVRRLIRGVVTSESTVVFPAGEQVQRPGLDGTVEAETGNQFVPSGKSAWEMGVTNDKKLKADEDFDKRTMSTSVEVLQESTFVFVTPREWRTKDKWAEEKEKNSKWKSVKVLDANDLEHWIELCPAVDVWFSTSTGRRPEGLLDLSARWAAISSISSVALRPELLLVSREASVEKLLSWFSEAPDSLMLRSGTIEDGIDFLAAFVAKNLHDSPHLERVFVVNDINAWRRLAVSREQLILVLPASVQLNAEDVAEAVRSGHHAIVVGNRVSPTYGTELILPRQEVHQIAETLRECGFDDATSRSAARSCCGSSSILKRQLTRHPQTRFPTWSNEQNRALLAPFALVGGWVHADPKLVPKGPLPDTTPIDLMCVQEFMGVDQDSLEMQIAQWSATDEPLFLRFRNHIVVGSREDAWFLLGGSITPGVLRRFEDLASLVLDEDNPAFDLEGDQRWMASIYGKTHSLSSELRNGIIESLALMAVYPTVASPVPGVNYPSTVNKVLNIALPAEASWKRWATFDRQLTLFAEADPDFLLTRIERDLSSESPQIPHLFENSGTDFFSSNLHCGLLWALETMAWSASFLPRVASVLAQLVEVENRLGKNIGNRPSASLQNIFLWWLPHTNASVDERLTQLRRIHAQQPVVGWSLLSGLLPKGTSAFADPSVMPRWRTWAVGWSRGKVRQDAPNYLLRIADLVIELADKDPQRWADVFEGLFRCTPEIRMNSVEQLKRVAATSNEVAGRTVLWKALSITVSRHARHIMSDWAFDQELLDELASIRDMLVPSDPVDANEWLFSNHPDLPNVDLLEDHDRYDTELLARRKDAIQKIVSALGWEGLKRLIITSRDAASIGRIVGTEGILDAQQLGLSELIEASDQSLRQFACSYSATSFGKIGFSFLLDLKLRKWTANASSRVLCCIPFEPASWNWITENVPQSHVDSYWTTCRGFVREGRSSELEQAIETLLQYRRAFSAADMLQMAMRWYKCDAELAYKVLEAGLSRSDNEESVKSIDTYATQELIKYLQQQSADQSARLARIEWGYLSLLDPHGSEVVPATLLMELQRNPSLFVDLLKLVYRGRSETPREEPLDESEQFQCRHAQELLNIFERVPGFSEEGSVDSDTLMAWIVEARRLAVEVDRIEITDRQIGKLLSHSPQVDGESWPPDAVCLGLETVGTDNILEGFTNGLISGRGVTSRSPFAGGDQERTLAAKYRQVAERCQASYPRLASALRGLAEHYDQYAEHEDEKAERRKLER